MEPSDGIVIADMEAGIGILTRMEEASFDLGIIVTDSSVKAIEVARRARDLTAERKLGPVVFVANKVRDSTDIELIRAGLALDATDLLVVPDDESVMRADRDGLSPIDTDPTSPAITAISSFAATL